MLDDVVLDTTYRLCEKLKGGPLRSSERQEITDFYGKASGSRYARAKAALEHVLPMDKDLLKEKAEANEDVRKLLEELETHGT